MFEISYRKVLEIIIETSLDKQLFIRCQDITKSRLRHMLSNRNRKRFSASMLHGETKNLLTNTLIKIVRLINVTRMLWAFQITVLAFIKEHDWSIMYKKLLHAIYV